MDSHNEYSAEPSMSQMELLVAIRKALGVDEHDAPQRVLDELTGSLNSLGDLREKEAENEWPELSTVAAERDAARAETEKWKQLYDGAVIENFDQLIEIHEQQSKLSRFLGLFGLKPGDMPDDEFAHDVQTLLNEAGAFDRIREARCRFEDDGGDERFMQTVDDVLEAGGWDAATVPNVQQVRTTRAHRMSDLKAWLVSMIDGKNRECPYREAYEAINSLESRLEAERISHPTDICDCRFDYSDGVQKVRRQCAYHKGFADRLDAAEKALAEKRGFGDPVSFMEHHAVLGQLKAAEGRLDAALAELEDASPMRACARCGKQERSHIMVPEEGDEWECVPCNELHNAKERAAIQAECGHIWAKAGTVADGDYCKRCGARRPAGGVERVVEIPLLNPEKQTCRHCGAPIPCACWPTVCWYRPVA